MRLSCALLLLALAIALTGCSTPLYYPGVDLDRSTPLKPNEGSFSIAIVFDTSKIQQTYWSSMYIGHRLPSGESDGQQFHLKMVPLGAGLMGVYAVLPAGKYTLSDIEAGDYNGASQKATLPSNITIDVQAGRHADYGVLIYFADPVIKDQLHYAWLPSTPDIFNSMKSYVNLRHPAPEIDVRSPWDAASGDHRQALNYVLTNPVANDFAVYPSGALLVPAHLGRISFRDDKHRWHVLDTGQLDDVTRAIILKDGRIVALTGDSILISRAPYTQWKTLDGPAGGIPNQIGELADGRLYLVTYETWKTGEKGNPSKGLAFYLGDADHGSWKLMQRLEDANAAAADERNLYLYVYSKLLQTTDIRTGATHTTQLPAFYLKAVGNGVLIANMNVGFASTSYDQYVSTDAGASWHEIKGPPHTKNFEAEGFLEQLSPGVYFSLGKKFGSGGKASSDHAGVEGYYETRDFGMTWNFIAPPAVDPSCQYVDSKDIFMNGYATSLRDIYALGKLWTLCEDGRIWSYNLANTSITHEREILMPAPTAH